MVTVRCPTGRPGHAQGHGPGDGPRSGSGASTAAGANPVVVTLPVTHLTVELDAGSRVWPVASSERAATEAGSAEPLDVRVVADRAHQLDRRCSTPSRIERSCGWPCTTGTARSPRRRCGRPFATAATTRALTAAAARRLAVALHRAEPRFQHQLPADLPALRLRPDPADARHRTGPAGRVGADAGARHRGGRGPRRRTPCPRRPTDPARSRTECRRHRARTGHAAHRRRPRGTAPSTSREPVSRPPADVAGAGRVGPSPPASRTPPPGRPA